MEILSLHAPPTQKETHLREIPFSLLDPLFAFFLKKMTHKSSKHGGRGKFRIVLKNKKNEKRWIKLAKQYDIFGTAGTHETGGEKLARIYHHVTLPRIMKRIRRYHDKETGRINWSAVDQEGGGKEPCY